MLASPLRSGKAASAADAAADGMAFSKADRRDAESAAERLEKGTRSIPAVPRCPFRLSIRPIAKNDGADDRQTMKAPPRPFRSLFNVGSSDSANLQNAPCFKLHSQCASPAQGCIPRSVPVLSGNLH